jgi:rod shape determining protein RodA
MIFLGWVNIYAAVYDEEHSNIFDFTQRYGKQMIWIIASMGLIFFILIIDSKFYSFFSFFIYGFVILSLLLVLILGREVHGARSWFELGMFRLQPAEFAKFATVIALAKLLSTYGFKINTIKNFLLASIIIFTPSALILLQNDTGSALVYFALLIVLYREGLSGTILFIGLVAAILFVLSLVTNVLYIEIGLVFIGAFIYWLKQRSLKQAIIGILIFTVISIILYFSYFITNFKIPEYLISIISLILSFAIYSIYAYRLKVNFIYLIIPIIIGSMFYTISVNYFYENILEPHQQRRISTLLGLESDPLGIGYNVNQSKIAIGSGGPFGKGFLQGTQTKFDFVPEQSTDFIFCTVGEEWGFLGTTVIVLLFATLLIRLVMLAERQRSVFSRAFGYGVISIIFFHVAINIGMTIGIAPVIGIPLPFFSYGGSSLWGFTILLFIFLRLDVSRNDILY